jgi:hypothetical protein
MGVCQESEGGCGRKGWVCAKSQREGVRAQRDLHMRHTCVGAGDETAGARVVEAGDRKQVCAC